MASHGHSCRMIWMDLAVLEHAESSSRWRFSSDGFEDTRRSAQFVMSRPRIIRTNAELKFELILEKWRISLADCHFPRNEQVCWGTYEVGESVHYEEMATGSGFLHGETRCGNQVHNHIPSPRCLYQLNNGSGMIFLPSTTSVKDHCHGESRRERQEMDESGIAGSSSTKEVTRKDFSIAWIQTCVPSKVVLEEPKIILHCCTMYKFRTNGVSTVITLVVPLCSFHCSIGIDCRGKRCKRRKTNRILHCPAFHERWAREIPNLVKTTKGTLQEQVENNPGCNILD